MRYHIPQHWISSTALPSTTLRCKAVRMLCTHTQTTRKMRVYMCMVVYVCNVIPTVASCPT